MLKIIECPRDALQGLHDFVPTEVKARYIDQLLRVGFDTIDFGSFVSPKAIPQMRDTAAVLKHLQPWDSPTRLLAIVANQRGAEAACQFDEVAELGFPFSISETFQKRNTNSTIEESFKRVEAIRDLCMSHRKKLVIYLSMAFGNPYGDPWDIDIAAHWVGRLHRELGIDLVALGDTTGTSNEERITQLFTALMTAFPDVEFGAHLHSTPQAVEEKIAAAYKAGCLRFDGTIKGFGGCPMAADTLTGNTPTEQMLAYFARQGETTAIDQTAFDRAAEMAVGIFPR